MYGGESGASPSVATLQGPLFVMSQNRQSLKDRARANTDFEINLKNEVNLEKILRELAEFQAEANERFAALEEPAGGSIGSDK